MNFVSIEECLGLSRASTLYLAAVQLERSARTAMDEAYMHGQIHLEQGSLVIITPKASAPR